MIPKEQPSQPHSTSTNLKPHLRGSQRVQQLPHHSDSRLGRIWKQPTFWKSASEISMNFQPPRKVQSYIRPAAMRRPSSQLNRLPQVRHVTEIRSWSEGVRQTKGSTHVQLIAVSLLQFFNMKKVIKIGEGGKMIKNGNIWKVSNWKVSNPQRMAAMSHDILPIVQQKQSAR